MLASSISNTWRCHSTSVSCNFVLDTLFWVFGRCYCQCLFSHNLLFGRCYCHLPFCGRCYTTRSDVKTCVVQWYGCCYHLFYIMSELTWWTDVIAIDFLCDWCYCHILVFNVVVWQMLCHVVFNHLQLLHRAVKLPMADVIAIDSFVRLMLLPYSGNVVWLMFLPGGWCYCHMIAVHVWLVLLPGWLMENPPMGVVADVIAKVADGIATG